MANKYDVAAFIWPSYTGDEPRTRIFWPEGYGEWQTVKAMKPFYPGHTWPRKPLWGYVNEADPYVMEMQINAAADHGVNVFIYDWYWFDNRPFLEQCLDNGYLKAKNNDRVKFYIMWANHTATSIWDKRTAEMNYPIWDGAVNRTAFETVVRRTIDMYFSHPSYYKIDGKPVFMVYDLPQLIAGLGGVEQTADALKWFKKEVKKAGFPGLELQFAMWSINLNYSGFDGGKTENPENDFIRTLGFTGTTHYQFAHFANVDQDYLTILEQVRDEWARIDTTYDFTYYPHISVGWDNSPRTGHSAVVKNNTPENFARGLRMAREYIDAHPDRAPLITVNSWNEWTETSYLMPCNVFGYGYLEAVKKVFIDIQ